MTPRLLMLVATPAISPCKSGIQCHPSFLLQRKGGVRLPSGSLGTPPNPTTSPRSLIIIGVFHHGAAAPKGLTISVAPPFSHSTACLAVPDPTALSQSPEM